MMMLHDYAATMEATTTSSTTRTCQGCGQTKPVHSGFYNTHKCIKKLCKECVRARSRVRSQVIKAQHATGQRATPDVHRCGRCKIAKPQHEFTVNRTRASGLNSACKQCVHAGHNLAKEVMDAYQTHCGAPYNMRARWLSLYNDSVPHDYCCKVCRVWKDMRTEYSQHAWAKGYACKDCLLTAKKDLVNDIEE